MDDSFHFGSRRGHGHGRLHPRALLHGTIAFAAVLLGYGLLHLI